MAVSRVTELRARLESAELRASQGDELRAALERTRDQLAHSQRYAEDCGRAMVRNPEVERWQGIARRLADAIRLTREYVEPKVALPARPGWSWYDAITEWSAAVGSPPADVIHPRPSPCCAATIKHESHSTIPYCSKCQRDIPDEFFA